MCFMSFSEAVVRAVVDPNLAFSVPLQFLAVQRGDTKVQPDMERFQIASYTHSYMLV